MRIIKRKLTFTNKIYDLQVTARLDSQMQDFEAIMSFKSNTNSFKGKYK